MTESTDRKVSFDRRSLLLAAPAGLLAAAASQAAVGKILYPEAFGARGDGSTDDTRAVQQCLDRAARGDVVRLRSGATYRINTNHLPTTGAFGGLKLNSGQTLELNNATLKALPSGNAQGAVIQSHGADGWSISGPGRILGERDIHRGSGGEWGIGIAVFSSNDWSVGKGVEISNCWGDGILVMGRVPGRIYSENFVIDGVHVWNCRRNGISICGAVNGDIRGVNIHDINGTSPQGAIDLEPDHVDQPNRNIRISGGRLRSAQVGIYVAVSNDDVLITGMDIECSNSGIIVGERCARITIRNNPRIASQKGGVEGGAIRTVGTDTSNIESLHITGNTLVGGGHFVVDIHGLDYPDLRITNNLMDASNPGVQGIARVGSALFTDNRGVIQRNAGKPGEYYVLFDRVTFGRNTYRNLSPHRMVKVVREGGRDLGGEKYTGPQ